MKRPIISILIPVKNASNFLRPCIESILNQSYPYWELMVVDDHSTDQSKAVLMEFSKDDARIRFMENDGDGIIDALRLAYSQSTGSYITRMDADDLMSQNKLETLLDQLIRSGRGHLALGQVQYFSENDLGDGYKKYAEWLNGLTEQGTNFSDIYRECVVPSPCWMVHREDFELAGAFNRNAYPEDYDLCFRFYEAGLTCIPSSDILHLWRDHEHRTSRTSVVYADNHFVDLKLHYFFRNHHDSLRTLMLWSAGSHAKKIAKYLIRHEHAFKWICNNPNKIGHNIYGKVLGGMDDIDWSQDPQIIVVVSNDNAKIKIRKELSARGQEEMKDYFFFC